MNRRNAVRIAEMLDPAARVVDVGGGGSPFPRADCVVDLNAYEERAGLGRQELDIEERFTAETWIQLDVCRREPWPFADNAFDYAVCSHLLEDVRDPVWVCAELSRIAKAGYVEVPSRVVEQSRGIEHPRYAGYYHHRWLVNVEDGRLCFRFKPHNLHVVPGAIVADVGAFTCIHPRHRITTLEWRDRLEVREVVEFNERAVIQALCAYAERARRLPDLVVPRDGPLGPKIRRWLYFQRLKRGLRT